MALLLVLAGCLRMMLPKEDLAKVVRDAGVEPEQLAVDGPRSASRPLHVPSERIVTSCGSGLTACIIGLGALQRRRSIAVGRPSSTGYATVALVGV